MQPQPSTPGAAASVPSSTVVVCCHGKDRADLRMAEFEQTAGLAAARHSGKGQCCLSYLSGTCRNGSGCPHLHPVWNHVQRLKWVPTPSGPSAAQLSSTPGTGSVSVFVRRTNRSYDVPADEFLATEHLSVAVRMGSGTACSHHLRETCMNGDACRFLHPSDRMLLQALRDELSPGHPVVARATSAAAAAQMRQVSPPQPRVSPGTQPHHATDEPASFKLPGSLRTQSGAVATTSPGNAPRALQHGVGLLGAMPPPVIASDDDADDDDDDDDADHLLGLVHTDRERDFGGSANSKAAPVQQQRPAASGGGGLFRVEEGPSETAVLSPGLHGTSITGFGNSTTSVGVPPRHATPPVDLTFSWSPMLGNTALANNNATSSGQQQQQPKTSTPPVSWTTPTLRPAAQPFTPGTASSLPLHMDPSGEPIDPFDAFAAPAPLHHPLWTSPPSYDEYHSVMNQPGSTPSGYGSAGSPGGARQESVTIAVTAESKEIYAVESKDFEPTRNLAATIRIGSGIACSHHLRDRCNNGSSCRFLHPIESVLATTLRAELGRNHPVLRPTTQSTPGGASVQRLGAGQGGSARNTPNVGAATPSEQPPSLFGPRSTGLPGSPGTTASPPSKLPKPKSQASAEAAADAARVWKSTDAPSLMDSGDSTTGLATTHHPVGAWAAVASRPAAPRLPSVTSAAQDGTSSISSTTGATTPLSATAPGGRGWETNNTKNAAAAAPSKNTPNSTIPAVDSQRSAWPSAPSRQPTGVTTSEPSSPTSATPVYSATSSLKGRAVSSVAPSATSSAASSGGLDVDLAKVLSAMWELRAEGQALPLVREVVKRIKPPVPPAPALALSLKRGVKEGLLTQRDEGAATWRIALVGSLVGEPDDQAAGPDAEAPPQREKTEEFMTAPQLPPSDLAVTEATKGKDVAIFLASHGVDGARPAPAFMMQAGHMCPPQLICGSCLEPRWSGTAAFAPCTHAICTNCTFAKLCKVKKAPVCPICSTVPATILGAELAVAPSALASLPVRCAKCGWKGTPSQSHSGCTERPISEIALASLRSLVQSDDFPLVVEEATAILDGRSLWANAKFTPVVQAQILALRAQAHSELDMHENARADAEAGLKADPKNADCFFYKGVALTEQGKHGQAISALQKAISFDVDHAGAVALLAKVKEAKGAAATDAAADAAPLPAADDTPAGKATPPPPGTKPAQRPKKPIEKVSQFVATSVECAKAKDYGGVVECLSNTFDFFNALDRRGRSIILARRAIGYYRLKKLSKARVDAKKAGELNATLPASWVFIVQLIALLKDGGTAAAAHTAVDLGDVGAEAMFPGVSRAELHMLCPPETPQQFEALMEHEICQPFPAAAYARKTVALAMADGVWSDPEDTTSSGGASSGKKNTPPGGASSSALDGGNVFASLRRVVAASPAQLSFEADMFHGENPVPMSHQLQAEFGMLQCKTPPSVENLRHLYRLLSLSCIVWTLVHYQDLGGLPPESVDLDSINVEIYWAKAVDRFKYFFRQAVRRGVLPRWLVYEAARDAHLGILNRLAHVIDATRVNLLPPCYAEFALLVLADTAGASVMLRQHQFP